MSVACTFEQDFQKDLGKFVLPLKASVTYMQVLRSQEQALELEELKSVEVGPLPMRVIP